ncbi:uncharacterized protein [Physcomitrium patens]|uniref:uncharacterized protein isoform X1 n=1 Tax=Physcomitrium patens TaxID=3218 RepID=UPI003CCE0943
MARMWFIETAACDREWGVTVNDLRRVSEFECRSSDASTDTKHSADNCNQSGKALANTINALNGIREPHRNRGKGGDHPVLHSVTSTGNSCFFKREFHTERKHRCGTFPQQSRTM